MAAEGPRAGQPSPSPKATELCQLAPHWNRRAILLTLGASHIAVGVLHAVLGGYLAFSGKNLHLVTLKSWYPFWGPASFLLSGILALAVAEVSKTSLKALCLIANLLSFLCGLAGLWVLAKDLFLEKPNPGGPPIWRPYPNSTVRIQRLQQVLFSLTWLELLLPGVTAVFSAVGSESAEQAGRPEGLREGRSPAVCGDSGFLVQSDDLPPVPAVELVIQEPPPSYEEVTGGGTREGRSSREEAGPRSSSSSRVTGSSPRAPPGANVLFGELGGLS
ncbi:membrane-spanning 4-domains subfamily A member 10 [Pipistrellus kuhlii]|uniref:membrane-spanning 4-domains subfamily A member 10 n=1 Tax=Pipistrellus kuhlii TaxID=59472 RepID=UPI001E273A51|nr:membrane-spanning 4-domains subfamily A member 10 [Pipistrellus kuhlii]XP_045433464.1 membrane-spanning 4-domains subfamily A member 10 [Pipistrellus kuhlii]